MKSLKELNDIKDKTLKTAYRLQLLVCCGTGCKSQDSDKLTNFLRVIIDKLGYNNEINVVKTGCFGFCEKGPIVKVIPDNVFYVDVSPKDAKTIVEEHVIKGNIIERLLYKDPTTDEHIKFQENIPFYKKQQRIALRNCGIIDPEKIDDYIALDGYKALGIILTEMSPSDVIKTVTDSGLRGRGGGGFLTGYKWELTYKNKNDQKYIICNADEGDPGAFMDRSILEGDPHSVIEAMAIAAYAIGANIGYIYIRAEYPLAIERLEIALQQAKEYGLIQKYIFNTDFSFDIEIKYGAGAFVCGEETALINSIEGGRGEPNAKPPFPSESGLYDKPTCVNNVETLSNIPAIFINGSKWFSSIGTEKSNGTKVFSLAGKVNNVGLVEVPMGTTLREIIYDIGGGIKDNKRVKAIQTGGPSGGCIPEHYLDIPIDYESLYSIGSMMGSGGMIVLDEDDCMVNISKFYLEFTEEESCGKCTPCRIGNKRLYEILNKITEGKGTEADLEKLEELSEMIKLTSLCGLGQTSPNPILSTLKFFYNEYLEHVNNKNCPAGVCKNLKHEKMETPLS